MIRVFTFVFLLLFSCLSNAQYFTISGKITNAQLEPLAFVSIQVKDLPVATLSKDNGRYSLSLEEGHYDLVITMLGFKNQVISLVVNKDYTQNIILEAEEVRNLSEVVVKGRIKDRSEEIIRNVIHQKEAIIAAPGAYSCDVYIKAVQEDSLSPKKRRSIPSVNPINAELDKMAMNEISLHYDHENEQRTKEERTGLSKRGNADGLFFLSLTDGNFNLYNNLIKIPLLSQVPFLSPVSFSGLSAYRYKLIRTKQEGNRKIYIISFRPRQLSNVTLEGSLTIQDSSWTILQASYRLPVYHIPAYDYFEVDQEYNYVHSTAWMITHQQFWYYARHGKGKLSGSTDVSYNHFEFQKSFPKKYFGNELSATAPAAYERDSSFWEKARTQPLTEKEVRFIHYKDSIYRARNSKAYLDSIDRKVNKVTVKKILLTGQTLFNREKDRTWNIMPLSTIYQPIQFGGGRLYGSVGYEKGSASKKRIFLFTDLSYGFRNHDVNGNIRFTKLYNPFRRAYYKIELKRDFEYIFQGDAWINMIKRNNLYLDNSISLGHEQELLNGLSLYTDIDIAIRRSLSNYKTGNTIDSLFPNYLDNNHAVAFDPYNAFYGRIRLQYTPGQKYIREPKEKIILGSKWPSFFVMWRKGIPGILHSKVDFDYLEFGMQQELKFGPWGVGHYTIKTGDFLNTKDLRLVDYQFQRRGDPYLFMNPNEAFQSLDSTFPVFHRFYQGHYVHEFNGAILNKIPFIKKLGLREIAGGGFLIAPERNLQYAELFAGVEKVFKWPFNPLFKLKVGIYAVGSVANQFRNAVEFKIGFSSWDRKRGRWL